MPAKTRHQAALFLCGLSLVSYLLIYTTNMVLARHLPIGGFDDYSVAVAMVAILCTLTTLGLEKYALRCLPVFRERSDVGREHGYWRFSLAAIAVVSLAAALLVTGGLESALVTLHAEHHLTIIVIVSFLPVVACFLFLVETISASGWSTRATTIYRFFVPGTLLALIAAVGASPWELNSLQVAVAYGFAWVLGLVMMLFAARRSVPAEVWRARPIYERSRWIRRSLPFLAHSLLLNLLGNSGVIVLELMYPSQQVVGTYAVAAQTGTFVVLVATSTNRFYLPRLSKLQQRGDAEALRHFHRTRGTLVAIVITAFLAVVLVFGRGLLRLFGSTFEGGYESLCVIAAGASFSTLLAMAPYELQFRGRAGLVIVLSAVAAVANLVLAVLLASYWRDLGAALAYTVSVGILYGACQWFAARAARPTKKRF